MGDSVVWWRSVIQLRQGSSLEGRKELVLDGVKRGNKEWLFLTLVFIAVGFLL